MDNNLNNQFFIKLNNDIIDKDIIDKDFYYNDKVLDLSINNLFKNIFIYIKNINKFNLKKDNLFYCNIIIFFISSILIKLII
tara:strand:- start:131 stop:376 length:246 start_codon:yes stop_codon:yes gene_type:complete